jgi:hypothetical protein
MARRVWHRANIAVWHLDVPCVIADGYRNIVATVNLDCRLDLKTIALHARNAEYNPKVRAIVFAIMNCSFVS